VRTVAAGIAVVHSRPYVIEPPRFGQEPRGLNRPFLDLAQPMSGPGTRLLPTAASREIPELSSPETGICNGKQGGPSKG
jgi:hypothetical protein